MRKLGFIQIAMLILATASLVSCSQDEISDSNRLPEGAYPLEIASVSMGVEGNEQPWGTDVPKTRITEHTDRDRSVWAWDGTEKIGVRIGNGIQGTYVLTTKKNVIDAETPCYWATKDNGQSVTAWYPVSKTVDLADQSGGLAYVLKNSVQTVDFGNTPSLYFLHKLGKVRVYVGGTAYKGNTTAVKINNCATACNVNQGEPVSTGEKGAIMMHPTKVHGITCFEANLLPGTLNKENNTFSVAVDGNTTYTINLDADLTVEAGKIHIVTLNLHTNGTKVIDLSSGDYTINDNGTYFFSGSGNYGIKVTGGNPKIYLSNASINVSSGNGIDISDGTPTICVQGGCSITAENGAGIYIAQDKTVRVTSDSRNNVLTCKGGKGGSGIGGNNNTCGNIEISNVTVYAHGSSVNYFSAGIGGSGYNGCGTIAIDNANVFAYGSGDGINQATPGIGGGLDGNRKGIYSTITIRNNSQVSVERGLWLSDYIGSAGARDNPANSPNGIDADVDESSTIIKLN